MNDGPQVTEGDSALRRDAFSSVPRYYPAGRFSRYRVLLTPIETLLEGGDDNVLKLWSASERTEAGRVERTGLSLCYQPKALHDVEVPFALRSLCIIDDAGEEPIPPFRPLGSCRSTLTCLSNLAVARRSPGQRRWDMSGGLYRQPRGVTCEQGEVQKL
jgi:hypothetical protein